MYRNDISYTDERLFTERRFEFACAHPQCECEIRTKAPNLNKGMRYTWSHNWGRPVGVSQTSVRSPEDEHKRSARKVIL